MPIEEALYEQGVIAEERLRVCALALYIYIYMCVYIIYMTTMCVILSRVVETATESERGGRGAKEAAV